MKTLKNIIALSVLFFATVMFAETLTESSTLPDGTVIPVGSEMIVGDDGTVQYADQDGTILAQVKTIITGNATSYVIVKRIADGSYVTVTVNPNGSSSRPTPAEKPSPVTPATGGSVGGSGNTQGPTGAPIPNNPATVI